jgi:hypothetical protein
MTGELAWLLFVRMRGPGFGVVEELVKARGEELAEEEALLPRVASDSRGRFAGRPELDALASASVAGDNALSPPREGLALAAEGRLAANAFAMAVCSARRFCWRTRSNALLSCRTRSSSAGVGWDNVDARGRAGRELRGAELIRFVSVDGPVSDFLLSLFDGAEGAGSS